MDKYTETEKIVKGYFKESEFKISKKKKKVKKKNSLRESKICFWSLFIGGFYTVYDKFCPLPNKFTTEHILIAVTSSALLALAIYTTILATKRKKPKDT